MNVACHFCGEPVDPTARDTARQINGWETKALGETRKGGSDVELRTPTGGFAHRGCLRLVKAGVSPAQETLL